MTDVRLSKDCRFSEEDRGMWLCHHPTSVVTPQPDLVTDVDKASYPDLCMNVRIDVGRLKPDLCEPSGRYWEARGFG
jgi:hypothetical protein